jgi:hypothetical protein
MALGRVQASAATVHGVNSHAKPWWCIIHARTLDEIVRRGKKKKKAGN